MKNSGFKSIIVLSGICLVVAILLSSVNAVTSPIIESSNKNAADAAYLEVLPEASEFETISGEFPETVKEMKKDLGGSGFAFMLQTSSSYSKAPLQMILGIDNEGKILKLVITSYNETKGKDQIASFESIFQGKDATVTDLVAGVTYTSNAIKGAVTDAYSVFYEYADIEKSDEQKLAELYDLLMPYAKDKTGSYKFESVPLPEGAKDGIVSILSPSTKLGYIVTANANDTTVAMAINAYGKVYAIYDLDGNDLSANTAYDSLKSDAEASIVSVYESNKEEILKALVSKEIISSENDAETVDFSAVSSRVVAVYKLKNGNAYVASAEGYGGLLTVCYVINSKGEIVNYATLSHSERDNEYAGKDYGTVVGFNSYKERFEGKDLATVDDETLLIAESTFTSTATKLCFDAVKEAYEIMNGEATK